jgi:predicted deacetylase
VLHDDSKHPHLADIDQMCSTLRSNAIKILLVIGDDAHKITPKFAEKFQYIDNI